LFDLLDDEGLFKESEVRGERRSKKRRKKRKSRE